MNIDVARARRAQIVHEQEALVEGKTRLSRADMSKFEASQKEFVKLTTHINKLEQEDRDNGVWTEPIKPTPWGSDSYSPPATDRSHLHPIARSWVEKVSNRLRDVKASFVL